MTVNINTDIDTQIKQLDEMLEKIKKLEDKSRLLNFVTIEQLAKARNCSIKTAQDIFNDKALPVEEYGKQKVVEINALINWYQQRRSRKDSDQTAKN